MNKYSKIAKIIWWIYIVLLLGIVIIKFRGSFIELGNRCIAIPFGTNYNLIPFKTLGEQIKHFSEGWARFNLLGNIIPFIPFGVLLPIIYQKYNSFIKVFIVGISFILFAEVFQFFTRLGSFDVDDIILNMVGICSGYFIIWIIRHCRKER